MRLSKKLVSEVVSNAVGIDAVDMALYLKGKTDVSELKVAKDMKISIQEARAMLYRLYEAKLTRFERKRDKHKGWHISHWDFLDHNIIKLYKEQQRQKIRKLKHRLEREQKNEFFMCRNACSRVEFDKAVEANFKCPECGSLMNPVDNKRTIEVLNNKINDVEATLK